MATTTESNISLLFNKLDAINGDSKSVATNTEGNVSQLFGETSNNLESVTTIVEGNNIMSLIFSGMDKWRDCDITKPQYVECMYGRSHFPGPENTKNVTKRHSFYFYLLYADTVPFTDGESVHVYPHHNQPLIVATSSWTLPSSPLITADKTQLGERYFVRKAASQSAVQRRI